MQKMKCHYLTERQRIGAMKEIRQREGIEMAGVAYYFDSMVCEGVTLEWTPA